MACSVLPLNQDLIRAERVIQFIELLIVPSGAGEGSRFVLGDFQKDFIRDVYAPTRGSNGADAHTRMVQRAVLSIARKNGKTALIAGLVLTHLIGPEAIRNGEIYSAANDREQAGVVFKFCVQIIRADPQLEKLITIKESKKELWASNPKNGSFYKALSRDSKTKHGLNPSLWIYDELAQSRDRELYDTLDTATGARLEPLGVVISTQSPDPQHILSQLIDYGLDKNDPTTVCHLHSVPFSYEDEDGNEIEYDIFDENNWKMANPALGTFCMEENIRNQARRAAVSPSFENVFRNLHMNQRVDAGAPFIARRVWQKMGDPARAVIQPGEEVYLGLDLSATTDLSALVMVSAERGERVNSYFWTPKDTLREREKTDKAPYSKWVAEDHLTAVPGKDIDYELIALRLSTLSKTYKIRGVAYDRWRIEDFKKAAENASVHLFIDTSKEPPKPGHRYPPGIRMVPWAQTFRDMSPAIEATEKSLLRVENGLVHDSNPVLTFCVANATPVSDTSGNRRFDKSVRTLRIDGAVAMAMAIGLKSRDGGGIQTKIDSFLNDPLSF